MSLTRRTLTLTDTMNQAMETAGGLHIVWRDDDTDAARSEIVRCGIRAIELHGPDAGWLAGLPIEFVNVVVDIHGEALGTLPRLRGAHLNHWRGRIDFDALPRLEWFSVTEIEEGQIEPLLERERTSLHHLAVGRYRLADAAPLAPLQGLTHLAIGDTRTFGSLRGVGALPRLGHLLIYRCSRLGSLEGVQEAMGLRHVEVETCDRIDDLSPLARLPELRSVQMESRAPPSFAPLAGHPTLEYVWIVSAKKPPPAEVGALLTSPRLRFLAAGRSCWLRDNGDWVHVPDIYAMTHPQAALHERLTGERLAAAGW